MGYDWHVALPLLVCLIQKSSKRRRSYQRMYGKHSASRQKYNCDVMIVETGMESAQPEEGEKLLRRILSEAQNNTQGYCKGVFYWEPECKPSTYALGAFTEDGHPTCIMKAFQK